jgi:hypothetical protein
MTSNRAWALLLGVAALPCAIPASGYSVLTHEALIDSSWDKEIKPLLLARFPDADPEHMRMAHAYAYGGAIIQDMGYYPLGSKFFSDLTHYARSGDFILALLREAADVNEYSFALGALAHYAADNEGHPLAVNRAVPLSYPKLRLKYGPEVTYEDDPGAHLKTEFGFDVLQVARGAYASEDYHDFIGFKVSKPLLERAFLETYSLELKSIFRDLDLALGTYRYSVSTLIPEMTKTAWSAKKKDIQKQQPTLTERKFVYRMARANYQKEWKEPYSKPGFGARLLAVLFRIIPKVGPFRALAFKVPPPEAEKLFVVSFEATMRQYRSLLSEARQNRPQLVNENFDIGRPTRLGEYRKADETYAQLLEKLDGKADISDDLRANILAFYGQSGEPQSEKSRAELALLRNRN